MSVQGFDAYHDSGYETAEDGRGTSLFNWLGAVTSIMLVGGLVAWSYELTMRDVTDIPVVRALKGPMRVQPENPGGEIASNRGLAVNTVQSDGSVAKPATRVYLAPDPVRLNDDEDRVSSELRPAPREGGLSEQPKNLSDVSALSEGEESSADAINAAVKVALAEAANGQATAAVALLPGVKRSPRPKARIRMAARSDTVIMPEPAVATVVSVEIDPADVETGARLVQLGAFDDRDAAIKEWDYIVARHGDLIGERKRLIQEAESGGRSFYRLRMHGFDDLGDSRRLCAALLARGTPCIPVSAR